MNRNSAASVSRLQGFTIIEVMLVVAIIGLLAAVAIPAYRDNTRRASLSEVILAISTCRTAVSEGWSRETTSPGAGNWGCEKTSPSSRYVGRIQTTVHGEVRAQLQNLGSASGLHVYMKPYDTAVPPATGGGIFTPGQAVRSWRCGVAASDAPSQELLSSLPSSCRDIISVEGPWAP